MKRYFLLSCLFVIATQCFAQQQFVGDWEGVVTAGKKLRLVFHIKKSGDTLSSTMDSPDQGVTGIGCQHTVADKDSILIDMTNIGIVYEGKMYNGVIKGTWHQAGRNVHIDFNRTLKAVEMDRPQTPKPPFNYNVEDVVYYNTDKTIRYGATITMPKDKGPFPAVLLITGSGQQNRDEELFGHKPFAVIADYLTKKGYLVMRVDDRGIGQTTGDPYETTKEFAGDVSQGVNYLESRKEVDRKKIVLIGHSEGGIIAPMVASERKDIYAIVLMAGAGVKIPQLMEEQSAAIIENSYPNTNMVGQYRDLYRSMENAVLNGTDTNDVRNRATAAMNLWIKKTVPDMIKAAGLETENAQENYINSFVSMYSNKWFYYFLHIDPMDYLPKLSCKVLAINGDKDVQVISKTNLPGIKAGLAKSKSKAYEVKELLGLNHLFQKCQVCSSDEYGVLTETINPIALSTIGNWLDKNVKNSK